MKLRDFSALANASRELLHQGDAIGAERVLSPVLNDLKSDDVSVLHLMGLIMKAQDRLDQAERFLRSAVANALSEGPYYNDLGVVLQARGSFDEACKIFRAAIALMPEVGIVRANLVRCLMAAGDFTEAEREVRAYIAALPEPEAWSLLSAIQRGLDRREDSLAAAEAGLRLSPNDRSMRFNHAVALDRAGKLDEAIKSYENLATEKLDTAELAINLARALYAKDRKEDAESVLEHTIKHWPTSGIAHATLARMRWLRGEGDNSTALLEAEMAKRPDDAALFLVCADSLHRGGHDAKALRILEQAHAKFPETPPLLTALGIVFDELDRPEEGLVHLRRVLDITANARASQRNLLSTLLRAGKPEEVRDIVRGLRAEERDEQYLLACDAVAARMLGETAYRRLYDYERLVRVYDIPAPRGFFKPENFNASLADSLRHQHRLWAHPLDQSLRNGTQTSRSLLTIDEPNIKAFFGAMDSSIRSYIADLKPKPSDPVARRKRDRYRFSGCWSVRLGRGGFQPNHVHDNGWLSSAYFVSSPPSAGPDCPGWLKFGEPARPIVGCTAEFFVEPRPGRLVLFPSYMWHGTIPFSTGDERLSVAFDVLPV